MDIEKTKLELAFDKFNSTMEKYNEEITSTDDVKKIKQIEDKYDKLIKEEEKSLEASIELSFQEEQTKLKEEEESFITEVKIEEDTLTTKEVKKLKEVDLVELANKIGIKATIEALKKDTQKKVIEYYENKT